MNHQSRATLAGILTATSLALAVPFVVPLVTSYALGGPPTAGQAAPATQPSAATTPLDPTGQASLTSSASVAATEAQSAGVVLITTTTSEGTAAGTGMVLTSSGEVLTNYHVVKDSWEIEVSVPSTGSSYTASVVGYDATRDVALLRLADASGLATVAVDDDPLDVGAEVTVVGNAQGGGELLAASGSVTGLEKSVTVSSGNGTESLSGVIETDAAAVPGDSGGPMFDAEGEVTGMTTAGGQEIAASPGGGGQRGGGPGPGQQQATVTTVSYAVPIDDALSVVNQIRSGDESGTVRIGPRAYLGVSVSAEGLTVAGVTTDTPAADAGVTAGSQITEIDGRKLSTQTGLAAVLAEHEPGDVVSLVWVDASGVQHTADVTLGSSPIN